MGQNVQQKKYVTNLIHSFIIKCGENVNTAAELSFKLFLAAFYVMSLSTGIVGVLHYLC